MFVDISHFASCFFLYFLVCLLFIWLKMIAYEYALLCHQSSKIGFIFRVTSRDLFLLDVVAWWLCYIFSKMFCVDSVDCPTSVSSYHRCFSSCSQYTIFIYKLLISFIGTRRKWYPHEILSCSGFYLFMYYFVQLSGNYIYDEIQTTFLVEGIHTLCWSDPDTNFP